MTRLVRRPRRPPWCTGDVTVLLLGAFLSSVGVLFVAPYLSVYLYRDGDLSATAVGVLLGASYWSTRASGIVAAALSRSLGPRGVMLLGNGLRALGYLLLIGGSVPQIALALVLVGVGSGLFFPVSKAHLLRLVAEEYQMRAIATRNVCANAGMALGPLAGLLVFVHSPATLFVAAALVFGLLALLLMRLPDVRDASPVPRYWRHAAQLAVRRTVVTVILAMALLGLAIVQLESAFPMVVGRGPSTALLTAIFLLNALVVIVSQPFMVKLVTRVSHRQSFTGGFALFAVSFALLSTSSALWPLWLVAVVVFSVGEVWISLWTDDVIRAEGPEGAATVYGLSGVSDACGGLAGAALGAALVTPVTGALPGLASSYWLLGCLVLGVVAVTHLVAPAGWRWRAAPTPPVEVVGGGEPALRGPPPARGNEDAGSKAVRGAGDPRPARRHPGAPVRHAVPRGTETGTESER